MWESGLGAHLTSSPLSSFVFVSECCRIQQAKNFLHHMRQDKPHIYYCKTITKIVVSSSIRQRKDVFLRDFLRCIHQQLHLLMYCCL